MTVAGLILGSCLTLIYYLAQKELIQIYALDNAMADTIAIVWQCLTFVQLISGVNGVLEGAIAGNGRFKCVPFLSSPRVVVLVVLLLLLQQPHSSLTSSVSLLSVSFFFFSVL
jgi:Na+-driven multidrug efflux pump